LSGFSTWARGNLLVIILLPGMQFDIGREIRARVASAFRKEGIIVSAELDTGQPTRDAS
jgi:small conductance mechanosensitive channel